MRDIKENVRDLHDDDEIENYLGKLVDRQAFDKKGLIYGMGHAIYSLSDPRAEVFKGFVKKLAFAKGREEDFNLYSTIEKLAPKVIAEKRRIYKGVSMNVDFYSGFVYSMLDIPVELFTPIFAIARIVGSVSYTHLDVYKRQCRMCVITNRIRRFAAVMMAWTFTEK